MRFASRFTVIGLGLAATLLAASPALALNEFIERSCDPDCVTKPPKSVVMMKQIGDFDAAGAGAPLTATLAKGAKKSLLKIDVNYQWFALGAGFRQFTIKVNNKFAANFSILNELDSCSSGMCVRHVTQYYDLDLQESVYPGEFLGQPLVITMDSARAVDAGSSYQATLTAEIIKKK